MVLYDHKYKNESRRNNDDSTFPVLDVCGRVAAQRRARWVWPGAAVETSHPQRMSLVLANAAGTRR